MQNLKKKRAREFRIFFRQGIKKQVIFPTTQHDTSQWFETTPGHNPMFGEAST